MDERAWTFSALPFLCRMMRQPKKYWEPMTTMIRHQAEETRSNRGRSRRQQQESMLRREGQEEAVQQLGSPGTAHFPTRTVRMVRMAQASMGAVQR